MIAMSLNSSNLDAFFVCAQVGHFTKAAERLHISQSALSQRIKNLEDDLQTTLIIRERSGLKLTDHGEVLLRYCQTKDQIENQLIGQIKSGDATSLQGTIRIGGFSSIMRSVVLPALEPLLSDNPGIQLRAVTKELYELRSMLKSGEIDYMILDENLSQENLVVSKLGSEKNVLAQKRGYKGREVYLDHDENDKTTMRFLKKRSMRGVERHYMDDVYGIIDGLKMGIGIAVVPLHLIRNEEGIEILAKNRSLSVDLFLHHYSQPFYSKLHQAVVKNLITNCSSYL